MMPKLDKVEQATIGLYQEKIDSWQKLLIGYISGILAHRKLKPEDCNIDLATGKITVRKPNRK